MGGDRGGVGVGVGVEGMGQRKGAEATRRKKLVAEVQGV